MAMRSPFVQLARRIDESQLLKLRHQSVCTTNRTSHESAIIAEDLAEKTSEVKLVASPANSLAKLLENEFEILISPEECCLTLHFIRFK
ncbi:unnamed protein product [Ceratitis capitata]|uniref:(Mediterranean fruit fly) hypothetical protein n=1 Tax=Ceratitis capitata TaxID=7213 RepID=A0A811VCD8_CERCA|nr:unnamed protein product [Ceratitis capitata]